MALTGTDSVAVAYKAYNGTEWDAAFIPNSYIFYAGQGYAFPTDETWINKPTGAQFYLGMVMAFPRSAEGVAGEPVPADATNEDLQWKLREC